MLPFWPEQLTSIPDIVGLFLLSEASRTVIHTRHSWCYLIYEHTQSRELLCPEILKSALQRARYSMYFCFLLGSQSTPPPGFLPPMQAACNWSKPLCLQPGKPLSPCLNSDLSCTLTPQEIAPHHTDLWSKTAEGGKQQLLLLRKKRAHGPVIVFRGIYDEHWIQDSHGTDH